MIGRPFIKNTVLASLLFLTGMHMMQLHAEEESSLEIIPSLLPYHHSLEQRDPAEINLIVIHSTELLDMAEARAYGERILYPESNTGAAGHYYVDRQGKITRYVEDGRIANHVKGHNKKSIGIEVVNRGRYPNSYYSRNQKVSEEFPEAQIIALGKLINHLKKKYPNIKALSGHVDLDRRLVPASNASHVQVRRKRDPGPLFPWQKIMTLTGLERIRPHKEIDTESDDIEKK